MAGKGIKPQTHSGLNILHKKPEENINTPTQYPELSTCKLYKKILHFQSH